MRVSEFYNKFYPIAKKVEEMTGIPVLFALAQSALETGWGRHTPGNMFFDIKAGRSWKGERQLLTTTEYHRTPDRSYPEVLSVEEIRPGLYKYRVKDWFRKYRDPLESFLDWARLLSSRSRYADALRYRSDPYRFADEIARAGYATDPKYASKIKRIMTYLKKKKFIIPASLLALMVGIALALITKK